jgi:DNA-binding response OmpR family regulator
VNQLNEIGVLRERVAELEGLVRELRALLVPPYAFPDYLDLLPAHRRILAVILAACPHHATKERIYAALYAERDEPVDFNVIESHVSRLRTRLKKFGIEISSARYSGYWLDPENQRRLREMLL